MTSGPRGSYVRSERPTRDPSRGGTKRTKVRGVGEGVTYRGSLRPSDVLEQGERTSLDVFRAPVRRSLPTTGDQIFIFRHKDQIYVHWGKFPSLSLDLSSQTFLYRVPTKINKGPERTLENKKNTLRRCLSCPW